MLLVSAFRNTSMRQLMKEFRYSKDDVILQEKTDYRKRGWTDRLE
jgi:hypothetical protein